VKRGMRSVLALGFLTLAGAWAGAEEPKKPAEGPRIGVEPAAFDFGKTVQNKTLSKEFSIKNYGNQDLVIENVSTTCGCTVAEGYARTIKPGGSTPMRVSLETRASRGKIERQILVRSNDAATTILTLTVAATVEAAETK
jgi:hypothetical protein